MKRINLILLFGAYAALADASEEQVPPRLLEAKALSERVGEKSDSDVAIIKERGNAAIDDYPTSVAGKIRFVKILNDPPGVESMVLLAGKMSVQPPFVTQWLHRTVENSDTPLRIQKEAIRALRTSCDVTSVERLCRLLPKFDSGSGLAEEAAITIERLPATAADVRVIFDAACEVFRGKSAVKPGMGNPRNVLSLPIDPTWLILVTHLGNQSFERLSGLQSALRSPDPAAFITALESLTRCSTQPNEFHEQLLKFVLAYNPAARFKTLCQPVIGGTSTSQLVNRIEVDDYLISLLKRMGPASVPAFETCVAANINAPRLPLILDAYLGVIEMLFEVDPDVSKTLLDRLWARTDDRKFTRQLFHALARSRHPLADECISTYFHSASKESSLAPEIFPATERSGGFHCSAAIQQRLESLALTGRLSSEGSRCLASLAFLDLAGGFRVIGSCKETVATEEKGKHDDKTDAFKAMKQYVTGLAAAAKGSANLSSKQKREVLYWILHIAAEKKLLPLQSKDWEPSLSVFIDGEVDSAVQALAILLGIRHFPMTANVMAALLSVPSGDLLVASTVSQTRNRIIADAGRYEFENTPFPIAGLFGLHLTPSVAELPEKKNNKKKKTWSRKPVAKPAPTAAPSDEGTVSVVSEPAIRLRAETLSRFRELYLTALRRNPLLESWNLPPADGAVEDDDYSAEPTRSYLARFWPAIPNRQPDDAALKQLFSTVSVHLTSYLRANGFQDDAAKPAALLLSHRAAQEAALRCYAEWFFPLKLSPVVSNSAGGSGSAFRTDIVNELTETPSQIPDGFKLGDVSSFEIIQRKLGRVDGRCSEHVLIYDKGGQSHLLKWSTKLSGHLLDLFLQSPDALDQSNFCVAFHEMSRGNGWLEREMDWLDGIILNPWQAFRLLANAKANAVDFQPVLKFALATLGSSESSNGSGQFNVSSKEIALPYSPNSCSDINHASGVLPYETFKTIAKCAPSFADFAFAECFLPEAKVLYGKIEALLPAKETNREPVILRDGSSGTQKRTDVHPFRTEVLDEIDAEISSAQRIVTNSRARDIPAFLQQDDVQGSVARVFLHEYEPSAIVLYRLIASTGAEALWVSQVDFTESDWRRLTRVGEFFPNVGWDLANLLNEPEKGRQTLWNQLCYAADLKKRDVFYQGTGVSGAVLPLLLDVPSEKQALLAPAWASHAAAQAQLLLPPTVQSPQVQTSVRERLKKLVAKIESESPTAAAKKCNHWLGAIRAGEAKRKGKGSDSWSITFGIGTSAAGPFFNLGGAFGDFGGILSTDFRGVNIHPRIRGIDVSPLLDVMAQPTGPSDQDVAFFKQWQQSSHPTPWARLDAALDILESVDVAPAAPHAKSPYVAYVLKGADDPALDVLMPKQLLEKKWEKIPAVANAISLKGVSLLKPDRMLPMTVDESACILSSMPSGESAAAFFNFMQNFDLNGALSSRTLDFLGHFERRGNRNTPGFQVGDVYDVKLAWGGMAPYLNAPILIVDKGQDYIVFYTLDNHPFAGARVLGWRTYPDGSIAFYTRGVSQIVPQSFKPLIDILPSNPLAWDLPGKQGWVQTAASVTAQWAQSKFWEEYVSSVCQQLQKDGATIQATFHRQWETSEFFKVTVPPVH